MLPVGWLVAAVLAAVLLTMWVVFTLTRLDRLHARVDAAQAALDAQLVRRAAALQHTAERPDSGLAPDVATRADAVAHAALAARDAGTDREDVENAVGRTVAELAVLPDALPAEAETELRETAARVLVARRFYNDAVRDTRALRQRRMPRVLHLAGRRAMPQFFDIDDTVPPARPTAVPPVPPPDPAPAHAGRPPAPTEKDA